MANLLLGCDQTALAIAFNSCSDMTFIDENVCVASYFGGRAAVRTPTFFQLSAFNLRLNLVI